MRFLFNKKIIIGVLILSFILPSFLVPRKALAIPVEDIGNIAQSTISAVADVGSAASTYSIQLKEFVLDGLLNVLVKQVIRQMTQSVVNWINSGFQGSPAFIQNPGAFFLDVADQVTGAFLAEYGGPLTALCSPFSLDIQIALRFRYHPNVMKRYTCTLNTIIKNSADAVENASINGFTAGDFKQGGWPAFVSLTTEPQNNTYGAYLKAEAELSWRVATAQSQNKEEISNGRGFLSWKKCVAYASSDETDDNFLGPRAAGTEEGQAGFEGPLPEANPSETGTRGQCIREEIQTPGSVIESQLEGQLGSGLRQLELADEINEIVNALVAQLITQVLSGGLGSVSGSGPGDSSSYINNLNNGEGSTSQIDSVRTQLLSAIETPLKLTTDYVDLKKQAYEIYNSVDADYKDASSCFQALVAKADKPGYIINGYAVRLKEINDGLAAIGPTADQLWASANEAEKRLTTLREIRSTANTASTFDAINVASQKLSQLASTQSLTNARDIQDARDALDNARATAAPFANDAQTQLGRCRNSQ
jgi:hypothetical protein